MIWYRVIEHCDKSFYELPKKGLNRDLVTDEYIAELCAEDYHDNHDGWEATFPLTFALHEGKEGPEIGKFIVDREAVPQFTAKKVE